MNPRHRSGRVRLDRDDQQWQLDRAIGETGRVMHFQPDSRGPLPRSVRNHAMISKHLGARGRRLERLAGEARAAQHPQTALDLYFDAAAAFVQAQHPVFALNDEKRLLHESALRCYAAVRELAPYTIEHLDIEWEGALVAGNLHVCPGPEPRACVFFVPGCDVAKEMYPHPHANHALQRGLHLFAFDGPGQGESNLRDIPLEADNYERAASAAITELLRRPDVSEIVVYGQSFGSFWATRIAATDDRVRALAAPWWSGCDRFFLMEEETPRFKQLFAHLTRAGSEAELDAILAGMDNRGDMERIACPTLLMVGEYDPRSPLEEVLEHYDAVRAPKELWVFADQHHLLALAGAADLHSADTQRMGLDWLGDRLRGVPVTRDGQIVRVEPTGGSPDATDARSQPHWWD